MRTASGISSTATSELVKSLIERPAGQVSASIYETGRVMRLAPWLADHERRVNHLLAAQGQDGSWGGPDSYGLVPTLSATEALLAELRAPQAGSAGRAACQGDRALLVKAVNQGLAVLSEWLGGGLSVALPDTAAVELIVPALVADLNVHLSALREEPVTGLDCWSGHPGLAAPPGTAPKALESFRARLGAGECVAPKLLHCLEVGGMAATRALGVRPEEVGTVGCSPAATAAWLGLDVDVHSREPGVTHLVDASAGHGGLMPVATPITEFERAWVLGLLAEIRPRPQVPDGLLRDLVRAVGKHGVAGGQGLPPDADTTGMTLYTLARHSIAVPVDYLAGFELESHFCTYPEERTSSATTNAHVLEGLAGQAALNPAIWQRWGHMINTVVDWLREQQARDGSWTDKWHASPYYATACCALALDFFAAPDLRPTLAKAVAWVLDTQHADGSWGRWNGTVEETAYAVRILLGLRWVPATSAVTAAVTRATTYLRAHHGTNDHPALWHDKDLYAPRAVIDATVLSALELAGQQR